MKRILIAFSALILLALTACTSDPTTLTTLDGADIAYKRGKLTFGEIEDESTVFVDGYESSTFCDPRVSYSGDTVCYSGLTTVFTTDDNPYVQELCRDPLCDHSERFTCATSYGLMRNVIFAEDYVYFSKNNGVYRYSLDTLTTEDYAIFTTAIVHMFNVGRFLYIEIYGGVIVKVDLLTDTAAVISESFMLPSNVITNGEKLYLDGVNNALWEYDMNFQNGERITGDRYFTCNIQNSFQVYGDKLYFADRINDTECLRVFDIKTRETRTLMEDVLCFYIHDGMVYFQISDPIEGAPFAFSDGTVRPLTIYTGNKIYRAPLDDLSEREIVAQIDEIDRRMEYYKLYATDRYVYTAICHIVNEDIFLHFYRCDLVTGDWQQIDSHPDFED